MPTRAPRLPTTRSGARASICSSRLEGFRGDLGRRYRSLGCAPCTGDIASNATTVAEIVEEIRNTKTPERSGRAQDQESEDAFEKLRRDGYM